MPVYLLQMGQFLADDPTADITTFTGWATTMLSWFITSMSTVLNFFLANPIVLVGLVMSLIVAAIGMLRHIIGGSSKPDPDINFPEDLKE